MSAAGVVVVGAGQAGFSAASALRDAGHSGRINLIGDEPELPYQRPPLSKGFLSEGADKESLAFQPIGYFEQNDIELLLGERVEVIDPATRVARLSSGASLHYDELVLATGARPRLPALEGADLEGVLPLRSVADAELVRERLKAAASVVIVGGGLIGLEVAAVASRFNAEVTVIEALPRVMARVVSSPTADFYTGQHRAWGTQVRLNDTLTAIHGRRGRVASVSTSAGLRIEADLVLLAVGVVPNTELASSVGLHVNGGIVVDEHLRTSHMNISALGDCARFPCRWAPSAVRLESVQNAADQGRMWAKRLAGAAAGAYCDLPWFWSDQGDLRLQIVGICEGHDRIVIRGERDDGAFSVFCFCDDELRAVESVNAPADHLAVRRIMALGGTVTPDEAADPDLDLRARARAAALTSPR